jgi:hypothetical protein
MFCIYCGAEIKDSANFCLKCGKPTNKSATVAGNGGNSNRTQIEYQERYKQDQMMVQTSINRLSQMEGYYCFKCGCYVDRRRASSYGDIRCFSCGAPIIKPDLLSHGALSFFNYGLVGGIVHSASEAASYSNPGNYIMNYYHSVYYSQTHYPFEQVASDKGRMGEYLVEIGYQMARAKFPEFKSYIFYNLLIPEPNGSFQEVDAVVILGSMVYVIEAKNRSGTFNMGSLSDKYWNFTTYGGNTSRIYNPLMQNNEHVVALQHYLSEKLDFEPFYFNYVTLSGNGSMNWNIQTDSIDDLILGCWRISNNAAIERTFVDDFSLFANRMREADYHDGFDDYDDKYARQIIEALEPLIKMPEDLKRVKQRDRMADDSGHGKVPYTYLYLEINDSIPLLVRTNLVYTQVLYAYTQRWAPGNDLVYFEEGNTICWKNRDSKTVWYGIDSYEELREANLCVESGELYEHRDKRRQREEDRREREKQQERQRSSGSEHRSSEPDYEAMFFHGCNDLNTLNSRYKNLCKTFHPDGQSGDEETFKKMQRAYERLKERLSA